MSAAQLLERVVLGVLCAAVLATQLVVARNDLAPTQSPATFALVLWAAFTVAYALAAPLLFGAAWLLRRWPPTLAVPGLAFAVLLAIWNPRAVAALAGGALLASAAAALALGLIALRNAWPARGTALLAVALTALAFRPRHEAVRPEKPVLPGTLTKERLLVVGIDGADWAAADQLIARGELPNLAALRERGAWGPLATLKPTASPIIWTTAFTGVAPEKHGIDAFTKKRLRWVHDEVYPALRNVRGTGLREVEEQLGARGLLADVPVSNDMRRVPALWNVASAYASPMDVVEVWATWPAEPILGHMVTDRAHFWPLKPGGERPTTATHPPSLYDEIAPLIPRAGEIPFEVAHRFMDVTPEELESIRKRPGEGWDVTRQFDDFLATFETARRTSLHLMAEGRKRRGQPDDMVVYVRMVDQFAHTSMSCSELVEAPNCSPEDRRRFGRVVSEAYRTTDRALGEWLQAFGDGNVVVMSDHGWEKQQIEDRVVYGHAAAPAGLFVAAGPAFARGRFDGVGVVDMMPLFTRLKGFAVAQDFVGRVPEELFAPGFLAQHAPATVPSYGTREKLPPSAVTGGHEDEVKERLRALGYIE